MKPVDYPEPFRELARELRRLPGIGPRSAERIALWLASSRDARPLDLAATLKSASENLHTCAVCGFFCVGETCELCQDESRAGAEICVVENATDILPIERTGFFRGRYHVLGGRLAPLDHVGPDQLRIGELHKRIADEQPSEIILALSADVEGEATTHFLAESLAATGVKVTRIAHGLPAGGGLEHADPLTLQRALSGRNLLR
jgi:recombination protein RecR